MRYLALFAITACVALHVPPPWASHGALGAKFKIEQNAISVDDSCYKAGGPIFFNMGGEAAASPSFCDSRSHQYGALVVGYEHRFYGQSVPEGDLDDKNMPFLSVEQNLADAKLLVETIKVSKPEVKNAKVVAFGGSYSGATCAWFRIQYPETVSGCVSSSGVVNAIFEFTGFDNVITDVTTHPSPKCSAALQRAFAAVDRAFDSDRGEEVMRRFNATNLVGTKHAATDFAYAIADGAAMLVQYGSKLDLCKILSRVEDGASDDEIIDNLNELISYGYGPKFTQMCFYDSECLKKQTAPLSGVGERQWRFQKCSQLAYFQAAPEAGPKARSKRLTLDALLDQCEYIFGQVPDTSVIDAKYGGATPLGSNIFFLDFSDDPWKAASVNRTVTPSMPFCMTTCDGCGHCGAGVSASEFKKCDDESFDAVSEWIKEDKISLLA